MAPTLDEIEARVSARRDEPANTNALTADAVVALVAHVRDNGLAITDVMEDAMHTNVSYARAVERIAALEEKVAALEFNEAEAAELVAEDAAKAKDVVARALELDRLRAENAELRKRIASLETVRKMEQLIPPKWPSPQPIETAPLGRILAWNPEGERWWIESPGGEDTLEKWRKMLKTWGHNGWLPMPPPGGGK